MHTSRQLLNSDDKILKQNRVEMIRCFFHDLHSFFRRIPFSVWSVRCQGIVDVADLNDPGQNGDFLASQPQRVTLTVILLVMEANRIQYHIIPQRHTTTAFPPNSTVYCIHNAKTKEPGHMSAMALLLFNQQNLWRPDCHNQMVLDSRLCVPAFRQACPLHKLC